MDTPRSKVPASVRTSRRALSRTPQVPPHITPPAHPAQPAPFVRQPMMNGQPQFHRGGVPVFHELVPLGPHQAADPVIYQSPTQYPHPQQHPHMFRGPPPVTYCHGPSPSPGTDYPRVQYHSLGCVFNGLLPTNFCPGLPLYQNNVQIGQIGASQVGHDLAPPLLIPHQGQALNILRSASALPRESPARPPEFDFHTTAVETEVSDCRACTFAQLFTGQMGRAPDHSAWSQFNKAVYTVDRRDAYKAIDDTTWLGLCGGRNHPTPIGP